jgi:hypothetical protein
LIRIRRAKIIAFEVIYHGYLWIKLHGRAGRHKDATSVNIAERLFFSIVASARYIYGNLWPGAGSERHRKLWLRTRRNFAESRKVESNVLRLTQQPLQKTQVRTQCGISLAGPPNLMPVESRVGTRDRSKGRDCVTKVPDRSRRALNELYRYDARSHQRNRVRRADRDSAVSVQE